MTTAIQTRPHFEEGQVLRRSDLDLLLSYLHDADRRARLGHHTTGIVAGLQLFSEADALGQVAWFLLPGLAYDGYGRAILVTERREIAPAELQGQPSGAVPVWIGYRETRRSDFRPGFGVCDDEAYSRVDEGFFLAFGPLPALDDRRDAIVADNLEIDDARDIARSIADPEGPVLCDASVAYQMFPDPEEGRRWLIPLGRVGWTGAVFRALDAAANEVQNGRADRTPAGLVAETLHAAEGVLRLALREAPPPGPGQTNDDVCAARRIQPGDFVEDAAAPGGVRLDDLVWVEGHLRALGDLRLWGTELSFRNADGSITASSGQSVPLSLRRSPGDGLTTATQDVELTLGDEGQTDAANRLVIGRRRADGTTLVVAALTGLGRLGLGTADPGRYLPEANHLVIEGDPQAGLTIRASAAAAIHFAQGDAVASQTRGRIVYDQAADRLALGTAGEERAFLDSGGRLGLNIDAPAEVLSDADDLVIFREGPAGITILNNEDAGDAVSDNSTGRINFGRGRAPDEAGVGSIHYQHADDRMLFNTAASTRLTITNAGNVGIGTTLPVTRLQILGGNDIGGLGSGEGSLTIGSAFAENLKLGPTGVQALATAGSAGPLNLQPHGGGVMLHGSGSLSIRAVLDESGRLGLGTDTPDDRLEVRGRIRLGDGGRFALGAPQADYIVRGRVNADGTVAGGTGFTVLPLIGQTGRYTILFNPPFTATPTVVATPEDELGSADNLLAITGVSQNAFSVRIIDMGEFIASGETTVPDAADENAAFSFIAIGPSQTMVA